MTFRLACVTPMVMTQPFLVIGHGRPFSYLLIRWLSAQPTVVSVTVTELRLCACSRLFAGDDRTEVDSAERKRCAVWSRRRGWLSVHHQRFRAQKLLVPFHWRSLFFRPICTALDIIWPPPVLILLLTIAIEIRSFGSLQVNFPKCRSIRAGFTTRLTRLQPRAPILAGPQMASFSHFSGPRATSFTVTALKLVSFLMH